MSAAAAILSGKSAATMRALASAVLTATSSAGSSGYFSAKVYLSPLTAAVHVALKPSSVRASMKTSHTAEAGRSEVMSMEASSVW